jgi:cytochrome P450
MQYGAADAGQHSGEYERDFSVAVGGGLVDAGPHPNAAHAQWVRSLRQLNPDPATAPKVRWMFAQRLTGRSIASIARELNDQAVPCPSGMDPDHNRIGPAIDGERLSDLEILTVIVALVVAGAETAVDLHTQAIRALLQHPEQRQLLRERLELMQSAVREILRWSAGGKLGAIPRFPMEDIEVGGQVLEKGSLVFSLQPASWLDPRIKPTRPPGHRPAHQ